MPHVEHNDAIQDNNKIALQRYWFAVKCLKKPKTIVDYACGMGYGSYILREAGHDVIGVDKSEEAIKYARANYPGNYVICDIEKDIMPNTFDVGVCMEALCHLINLQKFIDNLKVKELIISAPIDPNPRDGYFYRLHNLSEVQFKELLKNWKILKEFRQKKYLTIYCKKT